MGYGKDEIFNTLYPIFNINILYSIFYILLTNIVIAFVTIGSISS